MVSHIENIATTHSITFKKKAPHCPPVVMNIRGLKIPLPKTIRKQQSKVTFTDWTSVKSTGIVLVFYLNIGFNGTSVTLNH